VDLLSFFFAQKFWKSIGDEMDLLSFLYKIGWKSVGFGCRDVRWGGRLGYVDWMLKV